MATFKATDKKKKKEDEVFKATSRKTYDSVIVSGWETEANEAVNTLKKYQEKLDRQEYFSKDDLKAYESAMNKYIESSNRLRGINKTLGKGFTEEEEKQWNDSVSSMQSGYTDISDYFSKYKTEKDFKNALAAIKQQETMRAEDVKAGMEEVNSILSGDELTSLKEQKAVLEKGIKLSHRDNGVYLRKYGYDKTTANKKLSELEEQISKIEKPALERKDYLTQAKYLQNYYYLNENDVSLEELESHLNDEDRIAYTDPATGKNITWQKLVDDKKFEQDFNAMYDKYSAMPDWAEKSTFVSQAKSMEELQKPEAKLSDFGTNLELEYIHGDDDFRSLLTTMRHGQAAVDNPLGGWEAIGTRSSYDYGELYGYDELEDKEKELATYLANADETAYEEYKQFLKDQLMERHNQAEVQKAYESAQEYPLGSSLLSIGYSMAGGLEFLADSVMGTIDEGNQNAAISSSIRQGVSDTTDWMIGNWDAFDFLYNTGMSMADSAVAMGTLGAAGGFALGLSAAGQSVNDALDRGLTSKEAFWNGVASGTFEMLFETISIGQFDVLKNSLGSGGKTIAKNIAKSMLVNAAEETLTEIANITYDTIANADFSNYETMVRTYVMQGMSVEQAESQAKRDMRNQVVESMASGAWMGLGFGTFGAVKAHKNAKAIESSYDDGDINTIISEGLEVPGSEAYKLAQQAQEKLQRGESLTAQEILDLQNATTKAFTESDISKISQVAEAKLVALGETGNVTQIAQIIAKQVAGQKLTPSEKSVLKNSKYSERVANGLDPEKMASGNYDSAWAENIGTDLINRDAYNGLYRIARAMLGAEAAEETAPIQTEKATPVVPYSQEYIDEAAKSFEDMGLPTAEAQAMAKAQLLNNDQVKVSPQTENAVESEYELSAEGKTININTDKVVNIKNFDSISESGEANLTLDDGMIVKASDLAYGSAVERAFIEGISSIKLGKNRINTKSANALYMTAMEAWKKNPDMTPSEAMSLVQGLKESYFYGAYNMGTDKLTETDHRGRATHYAGELSQTQRDFAYSIGTQDKVNKIDADQKVIDELKATTKPKTKSKTTKKSSVGKVIFEKGADVDESTLTKTQKANLDGIKLLAEISSVEFHVFKSTKVGNTFRYTTPDGTVVSANGWYVSGTNEIWVDLNAGDHGEGTTMRTAAHEISHYIKQWSPKKWQAMADLLLESFAKNGVDTEGMLKKQIDKIKRRYNKKNMPSQAKLLDMAHEEFVSDALTDMLTDGSIVNFMAEVKAQDRNLWQKIGDAIKSLLNKWGLLTEDYKGRSLDRAEAQALSQLKDTFGQLQKMYQEAFVDANETFATIGARNLADFAEAKNTDGETLFQYRAMEEDEAQYRDMLKKWGKMSDKQIDNLFTTIDKAMDIIKDNLEVLDYAWDADIDDRAFSPVKPNSDSLYQVSLDFSTLCRKRILQQTIQVHLQEALNQPLTREEGIAIRDALMALQEEGRQIEVACALCYVESARMKSPAQIKKFLNNREAVIKDFFAGKSGGSMKDKIKQAEIDARKKLHEENPNGIKGKDGTMLDPRTASLKAMPKKYAEAIRDAKKGAKESYKPTAEEQELINVAKGMTVTDFTSPEGLENLAKNYPQLFDAYTSYVRNATKSKGIEGDTWWRAGDSKKIGDVLIANMNKENGLRSQSWSDFQVTHILDYIAATIELSTRNAKEQAYSKVPDYVELMGQTGVMINMSLIPTREFSGKLDYDSVEGMAYKRALELREKYPATAGTICIGVDNKQIQMLLADSTIDYVIPYHKSGMAASVRKLMHIPTWSQYEEYQSEKNLSREAAVAQAKKYGVKLLGESDPNYHKHTSFSEWFDLEVARQITNMENANPTDKAMQKKYGVMYGGYKAMQDAANNYLKLCAERGIAPAFSHENADFTGEDNYWKLLIDRKMVNNATGEIIEQQAIKPIFDEGEVLRILNDELERYPSVKEDQEYATRKVTEKFLSGEIKSGMSAEAIAKVMKTPVDNIAKTNILASVEGEMMLSDRDSEDAKAFARDIDQWDIDERPNDESFILGSTGDVLQGLGAIESDIYMLGEKINTILLEHPEMTLDEIKKIPQILENPVLILKSKNIGRNSKQNTRMVIFGTVKAKNGKPILTILDLRPVEKRLVIDDMQKVSSAYTKTVNPVDFIKQSDVLYADKNKTTKLLRTIGFKMPIELQLSGYIGSISYKGQNVNIEGKSFSDVFKEGSQNLYSERDAVENERQILDLERQIEDIEEELADDIFDDIPANERKRMNNELWKLRNELRKLEDEERKASVKTSLAEIRDNLDKYRYIDLRSLAEGFGWEDYEDMSKPQLANALREYLNDVETDWKDDDSSDFYSAEDGMWIRPIDDGAKDKGKVIQFRKYSKRDTVPVSMETALENLSKYSRADLHSIAEQLAPGIWEDIEDVPRKDLESMLREVITFSSSEQDLKNLTLNVHPVEDIESEFASAEEEFEYFRSLSKEDKKLYAFLRLMGMQQSDETTEAEPQPITSYEDDWLENADLPFSERDNSTSNRSILANALEGAAQNDIERNKLAQYKEKIAQIEAEEKRLGEIQKQLFTKGAVESAQRKDIQFEAKQIANRINTYDRQLLNLESTTAIKNVLNREKALAAKRQKQKDNEALKQYKEKVAKTTKELMTRHQESRKKAVESREKTATRHKIQKVVGDLNNLLLKPTKERHVPEEMKIAVAEALDLVNMDTVDADTRVAKYNELIVKANDPDVIASLTETRDRILNQGNKMADKLTKLKDAYGMVRDSADDSISSMYDDVIYNKIESVQKKVGKTPLRNMSLEQLESVYELYKMVLTTVRDSNKAFAENIKETRMALGSNTFAEIKESNKTRDRIRFEGLERFGWQNLKPMQAIKTIGSGTLSKLWNNILYGQETFARDYDEAVKFAKEMKEKHGYKNWDLTKTYSFKSKSGKMMKINLEQMMSIYAYSKRKQADEHIEYGGIVLNEGIIKEKNKLGKVVEYKVNDSTAYRLDKMQVGEIISTLEKEFPGAKAFVDEMQKYLSETMGEKGNEVAMKMYGIKLFKEEHYFPLKSSKEFMEAANQKLKGDVKIKNKGMTKSVVEHARNPIVLEGFLDVWGNHVNEMALYHGLVLPLEDFSRTLNYSFKADDKLNYDAESVRTALHDAFGENADNYLNELLKAINGGVLRDSSAEFADRMISKFKKAKVMASLSVIVQQPTAIIRAMNMIEPKYFIHQSIKHKQTWEELKKYCPTAIIKETGSFDTNMGRTIVDMIKEDGTFTEKVGDALGKAPAYMDEIGWNSIWRALKKKVATEQKLSGEELLKECGKQMTLIINETQVYDSVMSRNELMRSKSAFTKMATAFMAEPTTVVNMIYGAVLDFKRGKKGMASKTVAATIGSVVINGLVSSMVYALRDDDDEETILEKYLSSATTEVLDSLNPLTYIPFVKDGYSILQGYKVERVDMTLIKEVVDAVNDFYNLLDPEAYEGMGRKEIASYIYENAKPMLTSICDMFGLPVGNVLRDAEAIIRRDDIPMAEESSTGIGYALKEGTMSALPKFIQKRIGTETKSEKLYDAIVSGDTTYLKRLKSGYKDDKAYESAVKKALRENDSRIREAAELRRSGEGARCFEIVDEIAGEKHFSRTLVISAVNAELEKIKREEKENEQ